MLTTSSCKMGWKSLLVGVLLMARTSLANAESESSKEELSSTDDEGPWKWKSTSNSSHKDSSTDNMVELVELLEEDDLTSLDLTDSESEPRFIGHLRRKLCRVGLGIGKKQIICDDGSPDGSERIKRSPQFLRVSEADEAKDRKSNGGGGGGRDSPQTRLFGGTGLDGLGLNSLLRPDISPSFGVHVGAFPFGYGYNGYGGRGSPFQFNLGPLSINPLGGLRFSLRNGRPFIRPTLDLLITKNHKHGLNNNFNNNYYPYHNRFIRDVQHPVVSGQPVQGVSSPNQYKYTYGYPPGATKQNISPPNQYAYGYPSGPNKHIRPSVPLKNYRSSGPDLTHQPSGVNRPPHHKIHFPLHKKVVFGNARQETDLQSYATEVQGVSPEAPILGFGKSSSRTDEFQGEIGDPQNTTAETGGLDSDTYNIVRDSRDHIYAKQ